MSDTTELVQRLRDSPWYSARLADEIISTIEALQAERDALKADAERLDWLLDSALVIHMRSGAPSLPTQDREGIDAAMKEHKP